MIARPPAKHSEGSRPSTRCGPARATCSPAASSVSRPRRPRKGATAVEFALIAGLAMFPIFLGIVEVGRGLMVVHLLSQAARIGCRTGVVEGKSTADITTAVNNFLPSVGINGDSVTVEVNDAVVDANTSNGTDEITVICSIPLSKVTWLPGGSHLTGSLTGQFTLRRE